MMKRQQRLRLKLLFLPLIGFFCMGGLCDSTTTDETEPPDGQTQFWPEYDYMQGYDVFSSPEDYAGIAFNKCSTYFMADYDDWDLPASNVSFTGLRAFVDSLVNQTDGVLDNKCYLFAIPDADGKPVEPDFPNEEILGLTSLPGREGVVMSFIFVEAIRNRFPNDHEKVI